MADTMPYQPHYGRMMGGFEKRNNLMRVVEESAMGGSMSVNLELIKNGAEIAAHKEKFPNIWR